MTDFVNVPMSFLMVVEEGDWIVAGTIDFVFWFQNPVEYGWTTTQMNSVSPVLNFKALVGEKDSSDECCLSLTRHGDQKVKSHFLVDAGGVVDRVYTSLSLVLISL
jgi:hypothetical protein